MINMFIPITPRGKGSVRGGSHFYKDEKTRQFMNFLEHQMTAFYKADPIDKPIKILVSFAFPKSGFNRIKYRGEKWMHHKPDIDNLQKALLDAGSGILWKDDCLIVQKEVEKIWDDQPGISLLVTLAGD